MDPFPTWAPPDAESGHGGTQPIAGPTEFSSLALADNRPITHQRKKDRPARIFDRHREGAQRSGAGTRREAFQEDRGRGVRAIAEHVRTTPIALKFLTPTSQEPARD